MVSLLPDINYLRVKHFVHHDNKCLWPWNMRTYVCSQKSKTFINFIRNGAPSHNEVNFSFCSIKIPHLAKLINLPSLPLKWVATTISTQYQFQFSARSTFTATTLTVNYTPGWTAHFRSVGVYYPQISCLQPPSSERSNSSTHIESKYFTDFPLL